MPNRSYVEQVVRKQPFGWSYTDPSIVHNFEFEEVDLFFWHDFVQSNWKLALYAAALYIVTIFGLERLMRRRPAFNLKMPLFWWNLGLGVFSIIGFARTLPGLIYVLGQSDGFFTSICTKKDTNIATAYWTLLFILSKYVELGDTVFLVLRKKPVVFLQWYHHVVTMSVTWILSPLVEPIARWYTVLNYGVHSLMYPYFAAKALGVHVPRYVANMITTLQLAQMIIGFSVNILSMYYKQTGYDCARYPISIQLFGFVYGTFLLLFGKLFYESVLRCGRAHRTKKVD